jgi:hypothetical protein
LREQQTRRQTRELKAENIMCSLEINKTKTITIRQKYIRKSEEYGLGSIGVISVVGGRGDGEDGYGFNTAC